MHSEPFLFMHARCNGVYLDEEEEATSEWIASEKDFFRYRSIFVGRLMRVEILSDRRTLNIALRHVESERIQAR